MAGGINMNDKIRWEGLIDSTWFGMVAGYLKSPTSPITHLIHVKDREMLRDVAQLIHDDLMAGAASVEDLSSKIQDQFAEGSLKASARSGMADVTPENSVDPSTVRTSASCEVLWVEPFYVVHTPGLFEGKVMSNPQEVQESSHSKTESEHQASVLSTKDHDQDISQ